MVALPPAADETAAASALSANALRWVIVVEADLARGESARKAWEDAGFGVEIASCPQDALELLQMMTPSFVVVGGKAFRLDPR